MKIGRWAQILLAALPLIAGCGSFWQAPSSSSGGGGTSTTTLTSGYFYILDFATDQIISYYVNAGALTLVGTTTVPSTPIALAVAPDNNYLCVSTFDGIYTYTLSSGVLSTSPTHVSSDPAVAMAIDPASSSWIIETSGQGTLYAVSVTSTGEQGSLSTKSVALTGGTIHQIAISPDDGYVFVAADSNGTAAFGFTNSNGSLGNAAYATISGTAYSVAVDPSTRLLYIGQINTVNSSGGLRAFTIGTSGVLTEISGSPMASGGTNPHAILPESAGNTVYVANWNATSNGIITGFTVAASGSSYTLTKLSATATTGPEPLALAEDSSSQFIFAINSGEPYLDIFVFDTTTTTKLDTSLTSSAYVPVGLGAQ
jgi:6-phosphogluconolactonase (cycloisomerase 2 family)